MRVDVSHGTGIGAGRLMVVGNHSQNAQFADLLDHSAAKIREYHKIRSLVRHLL